MENYETWDLSVHDYILLLGGSAAAGAGTGWLFYDRPGLGLLLGALLFLLVKPRSVAGRKKKTHASAAVPGCAVFGILVRICRKEPRTGAGGIHRFLEGHIR